MTTKRKRPEPRNNIWQIRYGDGVTAIYNCVAQVSLSEVIAHIRSHQSLGGVTAVRPLDSDIWTEVPGK